MEADEHVHRSVDKNETSHSDEGKKSSHKPRLYVNPTHHTVIKALDRIQLVYIPFVTSHRDWSLHRQKLEDIKESQVKLVDNH